MKMNSTAEALRDWCLENGVDFTFIPPRGKHPKIEIRVAGKTRWQTYPGSPSDRRGSKNAVSDLRRLARSMGWKPKEKPMRMASQSISKFDGQKTSLGAAGPVKVIRPVADRVLVAGVEIPKAGTCSSRVRDEAFMEADMAGANTAEVYAASVEAGWSVKRNSISSLITQARDRAGLPRKRSAPQNLPAPVEEHQAKALPPIVLEIAQAIAPIIARHCTPDPAVMAKADKWDAIADLVKGDT